MTVGEIRNIRSLATRYLKRSAAWREVFWKKPNLAQAYMTGVIEALLLDKKLTEVEAMTSLLSIGVSKEEIKRIIKLSNS